MSDRRKALIVWGGWTGHQPEQCARWAYEILADHRYDVVLQANLDAFLDVDFMQSLDLVVFVVSMSTMTSEQERGIVDAVSTGVGLAAWHGAATLSDNRAFQFVLGGQFVAHPGGCIDYPVIIVRGDDPITAGLDDFHIHSEQYYMHVDPSNEVLATTTFTGKHVPWIGGACMPVVWKRCWGQGRVFYSSLGHSASDFDIFPVRTITDRGMLWATRTPHTAAS